MPDLGSRPARPEWAPETWWRRLLPKTVIGLSVLVFFMGISSAFTGAVLYAYYQSRLDHAENEIDRFVGGFSEQMEAAKAIIREEGESGRNTIRDELGELQKFAASGQTLTDLLEKVEPSVWFVNTLDENGAPAVGSAFVVFADAETSYLLASYATVRASTVQPAPAITIRKGDEELPATLFTWDPGRDMALLTVGRPNMTALTWASGDDAVRLGDRVFAISGLGAAGGAISQGFVADVSANGIQHDTPLGTAFQGGPLVNSNGEVVAVSSRTYAPLGFEPGVVWFAPPVRTACETVLTCPDGAAAPPG